MKSNRWFTKTGKAKRISKDLESFRDWADENKKNLIAVDSIKLVISVRLKYQLGLFDATNLMVYLVGVYSNAVEHGFIVNNDGLYSIKRYDAGKIIAESIQCERH